MEFLKYVIIALIGGLAAIMSNKSIAVFNDGFRPVVPEYIHKRMDRRTLAVTAFGLGFGYVMTFVSLSLGVTIIIAHAVLLAADIIGTAFPETKTGTILAGVCGALWGVLLLVGLGWLQTFFTETLPYNFTGAIGPIGDYVVYAMAIFPAVAVAKQCGTKKGIITFVCSAVAFLIINLLGAKGVGTYSYVVNGETRTRVLPWATIAGGIAMCVGSVMMIVYAAKSGKPSGKANTQSIAHLFEDNVERIRKNWVWFVITGALISMASCLGFLCADAGSRFLLTGNDTVGTAALYSFIRALAFVPLVASTAIVTGVYTPAGITFVYSIGLACSFIPVPALSVIIAGIAGACCLFLEVRGLGALGKFLDKYEGVRDMGGFVRDAISQVLELALLFGSAVACNTMMGGLGIIILFALWLLNKNAKKPALPPVAVGPIVAIGVGILMNILKLVGLM